MWVCGVKSVVSTARGTTVGSGPAALLAPIARICSPSKAAARVCPNCTHLHPIKGSGDCAASKRVPANARAPSPWLTGVGGVASASEDGLQAQEVLLALGAGRLEVLQGYTMAGPATEAQNVSTACSGAGRLKVLQRCRVQARIDSTGNISSYAASGDATARCTYYMYCSLHVPA